MERTYMQVNEMQIRGLLEATKREGVEDLCCAMHDNGFFRVSCQPHHDFDGGTAWYSLEVVLRIVKQNRLILPIDSMIIVAFLHELHRIEGGDDSTLSGSRALAMLSQICPQFKLKQSEYEAILWYSYTQQDLKRMGEQAQAALNNPLRQALRSAKLYCIKNQMDWEELEAAMAGKRCPHRNVIAISGRSHAHAYRHSLAEEDGYENTREKTIRVHREKVPSPDSNAYSLSNLSIADLAMELQRRAKEDNLTNEEIKYIREIQDALPTNRYKVYRKDVDDSIKIAMNNELDRLCRLRRYGPYELAHFFSKNSKIFDSSLDYKEIYAQLKNGYGSELNFTLNTLQKKFGEFEVKFT